MYYFSSPMMLCASFSYLSSFPLKLPQTKPLVDLVSKASCALEEAASRCRVHRASFPVPLSPPPVKLVELASSVPEAPKNRRLVPPGLSAQAPPLCLVLGPVGWATSVLTRARRVERRVSLVRRESSVPLRLQSSRRTAQRDSTASELTLTLPKLKMKA